MIQTVAIEDNAFENAVSKMAAILAYTINNMRPLLWASHFQDRSRFTVS